MAWGLLYPNRALTLLAMTVIEIFLTFIREMFRFDMMELIFLAIIIGPTLYAMLAGAPFVPTPMKQVERMLSAVPLKKGMTIYDLGAGDGRLVYRASKDYGVRAIGYEFSPFVWMMSKILQKTIWRSDAEMRYGNFWKKDISDADVIVCYLLPGSMKKIYEEIFPTLKPGTLIISHAFTIPHMKPVKVLERIREKKLGPIRVYKIGSKATSKKGSKKRSPQKTKKKGSGSKAKPKSKSQ